MKRSLFIFLAILSLLPFYVMVCKWSGRDTNYRNAYPFYLNEPRREPRPELPDDVRASPKAPYVGLHGWVEVASLEVSLGNRHVVLNMPWLYAFLIVGILPAGWMIPALLGTYRRRKRAASATGESLLPPERVLSFLVILFVGLIAGFVILLIFVEDD